MLVRLASLLVLVAAAAVFSQTAVIPPPAPGAQILAVEIGIPAPVRNEEPKLASPANASTAIGTWTLLRTPYYAGVTCARNGLVQSPGVDYSLAGNVISSPYWQPSDILTCDYQ